MRRIISKLVPEFLKSMRRETIKRLNAERWRVEIFVQESAVGVKPSDRVLDAGAGNREYSDYFSRCRYESTEITVGINRPGDRHAYISELHPGGDHYSLANPRPRAIRPRSRAFIPMALYTGSRISS